MVNTDGTLVNGIMKDGAQDALTRLASWYQKGYIDPEFITTDRAILRQKIAAGNMAYITWGTWYRAQAPDGEYYLDATSGDPNARLVVGPPFKGPNGQSGYSNGGSYSSSVVFGAHLLKDEAKLNRCLKLIDELMADTDDNEYIRYGVEGVDWTRDPVTGAKINKHTNANDIAQFGSPLMEGIPGLPSFQARYTRNDDGEYNKYALMGSLKPEVDYINWASMFTDASITSLEADVNPAFFKGIFDIIIGARPVSDYAKLRSDWYAGGGQKVTDEMNRAYRVGKTQMETIFAQIK
jgi:putative aldouronate transport system substrate-binding protein